MSTTVVKDDLVLSACEIGIKAGSEPNRPRVEIVAYTGGIMAVPGWGDLAIDLDGLDASGQIALLADHDARVAGVVGHGNAVVRDGRLLVEGVMSGAGEVARQIDEMSRRGFAFQASVGVAPETRERIRPNAAVQVNGRTLSAPRGFMLVRSGRQREVSITPLGADADTSVAIAAARAGIERITMDTELQLDEQAIRAHERERLTQIEQLCHAPSGGGWGTMQSRVNDLRASAVAGDIEIGELSTRLLALLRDSRPRAGAPFERSSPPKAKVIEAALLMRAGLTEIAERAHGAAVMEAADRLGVAHTLDLCRFALEAERIDAPRGREEMVRAALSTFTLPEALGGAASRVLLDGYAETPAT